jgi:hypothetical protein
MMMRDSNNLQMSTCEENLGASQFHHNGQWIAKTHWLDGGIWENHVFRPYFEEEDEDDEIDATIIFTQPTRANTTIDDDEVPTSMVSYAG